MNFFHLLADEISDISRIEEFCQHQVSTLGDWKLLAQKCSLKFGRQHLVRKSDHKQLLIVCHSRFAKDKVISLLLLIIFYRSSYKKKKSLENASVCPFRISGSRVSLDDSEGNLLSLFHPFMIEHSCFTLAGIRRYKCSIVILSHKCDLLDGEIGQSIPFALHARDLASLPSVVRKMEVGMKGSSKDIIEAITTDLPVKSSELERLKVENRPLVGASSFQNALRIAREVNCICLFIVIYF